MKRNVRRPQKNQIRKRWLAGTFSLMLVGFMLLSMAQPAFVNANAKTEADRYADSFVERFEAIELQGEAAADVVAVAKTQLGYEESTIDFVTHSVTDENGDEQTIQKGMTIYGVSAGDRYGDWNGAFAQYVLNKAQIEMIPGFSTADELAVAVRDEEDEELRALWLDGDVVPAAGDLVLFKDAEAIADAEEAVADAKAGLEEAGEDTAAAEEAVAKAEEALEEAQKAAGRIGIVSEVAEEDEVDEEGEVVDPAHIVVIEGDVEGGYGVDVVAENTYELYAEETEFLGYIDMQSVESAYVPAEEEEVVEEATSVSSEETEEATEEEVVEESEAAAASEAEAESEVAEETSEETEATSEETVAESEAVEATSEEIKAESEAVEATSQAEETKAVSEPTDATREEAKPVLVSGLKMLSKMMTVTKTAANAFVSSGATADVYTWAELAEAVADTNITTINIKRHLAADSTIAITRAVEIKGETDANGDAKWTIYRKQGSTAGSMFKVETANTNNVKFTDINFSGKEVTTSEQVHPVLTPTPTPTSSGWRLMTSSDVTNGKRFAIAVGSNKTDKAFFNGGDGRIQTVYQDTHEQGVNGLTASNNWGMFVLEAVNIEENNVYKIKNAQGGDYLYSEIINSSLRVGDSTNNNWSNIIRHGTDFPYNYEQYNKRSTRAPAGYVEASPHVGDRSQYFKVTGDKIETFWVIKSSYGNLVDGTHTEPVGYKSDGGSYIGKYLAGVSDNISLWVYDASPAPSTSPTETTIKKQMVAETPSPTAGYTATSTNYNFTGSGAGIFIHGLGGNIIVSGSSFKDAKSDSTAKSNDTGYAPIALNGAKMTIGSSEISGNNMGADCSAGAVLVKGSSTLTMNSGTTISGNTGGKAGGVYLMTGTGKLSMTGGSIESNTSTEADNSAGAVHAGAGTTVEVSGGTIKNNTAPIKDQASNDLMSSTKYQKTTDDNMLQKETRRVTAGGVLLDGATMEMTTSAPVISGNKGHAGAVFITGSGVFNMKGGKIGDGSYENANVGRQAGAVLVASGKFNMYSGSVEYNDTLQRGTITVLSDGEMNMDCMTDLATPRIHHNRTSNKGGAIYVDSDKVYLKRGELDNNTAGYMGGAIYVVGDSPDNTRVLELGIDGRKAYIFENTAGTLDGFNTRWGDGRGGGIWFCAWSTVLYDQRRVEISDNHLGTQKVGGGIDVFKTSGLGTVAEWTETYLENGEEKEVTSFNNWHHNDNKNNTNTFWVRRESDPYYGQAKLVNSNSITAANKASSNAANALLIHNNQAPLGGGLGLNGIITFRQLPVFRKISWGKLNIHKNWEDANGNAVTDPTDKKVEVTVVMKKPGGQEVSSQTFTLENGKLVDGSGGVGANGVQAGVSIGGTQLLNPSAATNEHIGWYATVPLPSYVKEVNYTETGGVYTPQWDSAPTPYDNFASTATPSITAENGGKKATVTLGTGDSAYTLEVHEKVYQKNGLKWTLIDTGKYNLTMDNVVKADTGVKDYEDVGRNVTVKYLTFNFSTSMKNSFSDKGEIKVKKVNENGKGISGATFQLFKVSGGSASQVGSDNSTDGEVGEFTFNNLTPGEYYILEKTAPTGYTGYGATKKISFVVESDGSIRLKGYADAGVQDGQLTIGGRKVYMTGVGSNDYLTYDSTNTLPIKVKVRQGGATPAKLSAGTPYQLYSVHEGTTYYLQGMSYPNNVANYEFPRLYPEDASDMNLGRGDFYWDYVENVNGVNIIKQRGEYYPGSILYMDGDVGYLQRNKTNGADVIDADTSILMDSSVISHSTTGGFTITVPNTEKKYDVTLQKRDADNENKIMSGVSFSLYKANGDLVTTTETDENGRISFNNLPAGTYYMTESVPTGYKDLGGKIVFTIAREGAVTAGGIGEPIGVTSSGQLTFGGKPVYAAKTPGWENEPISVTTTETSYPLMLKLYKRAGGSTNGKDTVQTELIDNYLYRIQLGDTAYYLKGDAKDKPDGTTPTGHTDETDGAQWKYVSTGTGAKALQNQWGVGGSGESLFYLYLDGSAVKMMHDNAAGFKTTDMVSVGENSGAYTITVDNRKVGEVKIRKTDAAGTTKLGGAKFTLFNESTNKYAQTVDADGNVTAWNDDKTKAYKFTSASGTGLLAAKSLSPGNYLFKEVEAPTGGYEVYGGDIRFAISASDGSTSLIKTNTYSTGVTVDGNGHIFVAGKQLYANTPLSNGKTVTTTDTGAPLTLVRSSTDLTPIVAPSKNTAYFIYAGKNGNTNYFLRNYIDSSKFNETSPVTRSDNVVSDKGFKWYLKDQAGLTFLYCENGAANKYFYLDESGTSPVAKQVTLGNVSSYKWIDPSRVSMQSDNITIEVRDDKKTYPVKLNKVDADNNNAELAGATFAIFDQEPTDANLADATWLAAHRKGVDSGASVTFNGLEPGTYYIKETASPTGYKPLKNAIKLTLDNAGKVYTQVATFSVDGSGQLELMGKKLYITNENFVTTEATGNTALYLYNEERTQKITSLTESIGNNNTYYYVRVGTTEKYLMGSENGTTPGVSENGADLSQHRYKWAYCAMPNGIKVLENRWSQHHNTLYLQDDTAKLSEWNAAQAMLDGSVAITVPNEHIGPPVSLKKTDTDGNAVAYNADGLNAGQFYLIKDDTQFGSNAAGSGSGTGSSGGTGTGTEPGSDPGAGTGTEPGSGSTTQRFTYDILEWKGPIDTMYFLKITEADVNWSKAGCYALMKSDGVSYIESLSQLNPVNDVVTGDIYLEDYDHSKDGDYPAAFKKKATYVMEYTENAGEGGTGNTGGNTGNTGTTTPVEPISYTEAQEKVLNHHPSAAHGDYISTTSSANAANGIYSFRKVGAQANDSTATMIEPGIYWLVEKTAPAGYLKNAPVKVKVEKSATGNKAIVTCLDPNNHYFVAPGTTDTFSFSYKDDTDNTEAVIEATKVLISGNVQQTTMQAGAFTFELEAVSAKDLSNNNITPIPMPANTTATNAANGDIKFDKIVYTQEGDYTYTLTEVEGDNNDMQYDTAPRTVTVKVRRGEDGRLHAVTSYVTTQTTSSWSQTSSGFVAGETYIIKDGSTAIGVRNSALQWVPYNENDTAQQWKAVEGTVNGTQYIFLQNVAYGGYIGHRGEEFKVIYTTSTATTGSGEVRVPMVKLTNHVAAINVASGYENLLGKKSDYYGGAGNGYWGYGYSGYYGSGNSYGTVYTFEDPTCAQAVTLIKKGTSTVDEAGNPVFTNRGSVRYSITIKKVDADGNLLPGAKFRLKQSGTNIWKDGIETSTGVFTWGDLKATSGGIDYIIEETEAPRGYQKLTEQISVKLKLRQSGSTYYAELSKNGSTPAAVTVDGQARDLTLKAVNTRLPFVVNLTKTNKNKPSETVAKATFELTSLKIENADAKLYSLTGNPQTVEFGSSGLQLGDLVEGWYQLKETTPPNGFVMPASPWFIKTEYQEVKNNSGQWTGAWTTVNTVYASRIVRENETADITVGTTRYALTVVDSKNINGTTYNRIDNEPIYELPSSGGMGTYWNTIIGTMFLCMAGAFMLRAWANKAPVKADRNKQRTGRM